MARDRDPHTNHEPADLPEALKGALRGLFAQDVEVPKEVDRAILTQARQHLARRRRIVTLRRLAAGVAAAAAVVVVVWLVGIGRPLPTRPQAPVAVVTKVGRDATVDAYRTVTILDAFRLARRIEQGNDLPAEFDVNRDGVVDQKDVDELAQAAVRL